MKTNIFLISFFLLSFFHTTKAQFHLIKDINSTTSNSGSNPKQILTIGTTTYFIADDGIHGSELWKTDGTSTGTIMVKDIFLGRESSNPYELTDVSGTLFFAADNGTNGIELWKSNGTAAGTVMVKDINSGTVSSNPNYLTSFNGGLILVAENSSSGVELWKSNGTSAGTALIKDIHSGLFGSYPQDLVAGTTAVFFTSFTTLNGRELWSTDGTTIGTNLIKDIFPNNSATDPFPTNLFFSNNFCIFSANDNINGNELWKSDGSAIGTNIILDINPGIANSNPQNFIQFGDTIVFIAEDLTSGTELWRTDGTNINTYKIKDIYSGANSSNPSDLFIFANEIYFSATDGSNGMELWKTNGSNPGTSLFKDINVGILGSFPSKFAKTSTKLFFVAYKNDSGFELWSSDGTSLGTDLVKDIALASNSSNTEYLTLLNNSIIFSANNNFDGTELWLSDGTYAGTNILKNINNIFASSNPSNLVNISNQLFFAACDESFGNELWISSGTASTTSIVKDIFPNKGSSNPNYFTYYNGEVFFAANDSTHGFELWKTDGTLLGTTLVKDINSGLASSNPTSLINYNGFLYFAANDGINGNELWISDGTEMGTALFKDIYTGLESSDPEFLVESNQILFFAANNGIDGKELWTSDGDPNRTNILSDINAGFNSSYPSYLTNVNGLLFFNADNGVKGKELWKSNGTIGGTVLVKDINLGANSSNPTNLIAYHEDLYFSADDGSNGNELWKTNATSGTNIFKDIYEGEYSSNPKNLILHKDLLFFTANNGTTGQEIWLSNGQICATNLNAEYILGTNDGNPLNLTSFNNQIILSLNDNFLGSELFSYSPNPTILVSSVNKNVFCAGDSIFVQMQLSKTFNSDNLLTLQLSNSSGNFTTPTILNTTADSVSGIISAKIPINIPDGSNYKIRINSTSPSCIGTPFCNNITIKGIPQISVISNQVINEDESTEIISFSINDLLTPAANLLVSAFAIDTNLINNSNIILSGSGNDRSLQIAPNANSFGQTNINLAVTDADACVANQEFSINILSVNDAPTLLIPIPDQNLTYFYDFNFTLRANSFFDADGDSLIYEASMIDENPLPDWLSFNDTSINFSGTPNLIDTLTIVLKAHDNNLAEISDTFNLFIGKAPLFASAIDASKKYGTINPNFEIQYDGFVNNEDTAVIDTLPYAVSDAQLYSNVGFYSIDVYGGFDNHYEIIGISGSLEIRPASLTIAVRDTFKNYGETNPVFFADYLGLLGNDSISDIDFLPEFFSAADENSLMGDYEIIAYNATDNNYEMNYQYGNLTVNATLPQISTIEITDIDFTSANAWVNLLNHGGDTMLQSGVCWSENPNPTILNSYLENNNSIGVAAFVLNGLNTNTQYFVKSFAQNNAGIVYGNEISFTTLINAVFENYVEQNSLVIFPNPAINNICISVDKSFIEKKSQIKIYNSLGEIVYSKIMSMNEENVDISHFKSGNYLVVFYNGKNYLITKFSK